MRAVPALIVVAPEPALAPPPPGAALTTKGVLPGSDVVVAELAATAGASVVVVTTGAVVVVVAGAAVVLVVADTAVVVVVTGAAVVLVVGAMVVVVVAGTELVVVGATVVLVGGTVVGGGAQSATLTVLESKVTAPLRARSRPATVALVLAVMSLRARIVPTKVEPTPSVAELPTCQNTLQA